MTDAGAGWQQINPAKESLATCCARARAFYTCAFVCGAPMSMAFGITFLSFAFAFSSLSCVCGQWDALRQGADGGNFCSALRLTPYASRLTSHALRHTPYTSRRLPESYSHSK